MPTDILGPPWFVCYKWWPWDRDSSIRSTNTFATNISWESPMATSQTKSKTLEGKRMPLMGAKSKLCAPFMALALLAGATSATADCQGMVLHAHRGEENLPENSLAAVRAALTGNWDGVEIDVQQLRDRQWVIQHDPVLGRTTSVERRLVSDIDSAVWREIKLKDRKGKITAEPAPFLNEMLRAVSDVDYKVVNAEIKQLFKNCDAGQ